MGEISPTLNLISVKIGLKLDVKTLQKHYNVITPSLKSTLHFYRI